MKTLKWTVVLITMCLVIEPSIHVYNHYKTYKCDTPVIRNAEEFKYFAILYWINSSESIEKLFQSEVKEFSNVRSDLISRDWSYWFLSYIWSGTFNLLPEGKQRNNPILHTNITECGKVIFFLTGN